MQQSNERSKEILNFFMKSTQLMLKRRVYEELTQREIRIMQLLRNCTFAEGLRASEISEKMELTKPATSKLLNRMQDKGLITRNVDPIDRRVITVQITPKGKLTLDEGWERVNAHVNRIISYMGEEKADQFIALSKLYLDALRRVMDDCTEENETC